MATSLLLSVGGRQRTAVLTFVIFLKYILVLSNAHTNFELTQSKNQHQTISDCLIRKIKKKTAQYSDKSNNWLQTMSIYLQKISVAHNVHWHYSKPVHMNWVTNTCITIKFVEFWQFNVRFWGAFDFYSIYLQCLYVFTMHIHR